MRGSTATLAAVLGLGGPLASASLRGRGRGGDFDSGAMTASFDASLQFVSTSDEHAFIAPGPDDQRGPCPGLNALANHGYIPRNGVATVDQFARASHEVYGMGIDLAVFLSKFGAVFAGDGVRWSIGGPPPDDVRGEPGLVAKPQGLSNSHNTYETDASPTRCDYYKCGEIDKLHMDQFQELYDQPLGPGGYDLATLTEFRSKRWRESVRDNANFFNGPFTGFGAQSAAYSFIYRLMANRSAEHPDGYLDGACLKSFFAVSGEPGSFAYAEGHERIPDNWYRRAVGDEYTLIKLIRDVMAVIKKHPTFAVIGGNTGEAGGFTTVNITRLTRGVYRDDALTRGRTGACLSLQFARLAGPSHFADVFEDAALPRDTLNTVLDPMIAVLRCPRLESIDRRELDKFPGARGQL